MNWLRKKRTPPLSQTTPETDKTWLPQEPVEYPVGACVYTDKGTYFINKDGKRYRIQSDAIYASWRFSLVIRSTEKALSKYPIALSRLGFRDGTLLNNIADGKLYLVSESKLRHIVDPDVFTRFGLNQKDAVVVSDADIKIMKQGEPLN